MCLHVYVFFNPVACILHVQCTYILLSCIIKFTYILVYIKSLGLGHGTTSNVLQLSRNTCKLQPGLTQILYPFTA